MDYWAARTAASEAYAQRLAAKFSARLKKLYRDVYEILADELDHIAAQVLDHGKKAVLRSDLWRYSSITNLMDTIEQQADVLRTAQIEGMDSLLYNVFEETIGKTVEAFRGKEIKFSFLPENIMRQYLNTNWCGANYSSRIWTNTANLAARLKEDMMNLIATGKNPSTIKKKLSEDLGVGYDVADRLIRTEASHVYNTATMEAYRQQGINEVRISTGKDERVCPVCDEYQSHGPYPIGNAPRLPAHPNCRCRYLAVFDPEDRARQRAEQLRGAIEQEERDRERTIQEDLARQRAEQLRRAIEREKRDRERTIRRYISADSYRINEKLRTGAQLSAEETAFVESLDSALRSMPRYKGTVYRSITSSMIPDLDAFNAAHQPDNLLEYPAYTSAADSVYDDSFDIQMEIISKNGRDIREYNAQEGEIVFLRGTRFIVTGRIGNKIYMEEVADDES